MSKIEFHHLEEYALLKAEVICSFKTRNLGILQVKAEKKDDWWRFKSLKNEPDLNMLTDAEQVYVHQVCAIVHRMVYDVPAAKNRFRKS